MDSDRKSEEELAAQLEREANDPQAWQDEPTPAERGSLGAQVSVRLTPQQAAVLRRIARDRGVGYTSLLREWVAERLRLETARVHMHQEAQVSSNGYLHSSGVGTVQVVIDGRGPARWIVEPEVEPAA